MADLWQHGDQGVHLRIGAKLPHSGPLASRLGIARMATKLEEAGFDSVWVSDHVVFPHEVRSRYPFSLDGRVTWPVDVDYYEPMVVLPAAAAVTTKVELGTAVLVLPIRNPVMFAKQAATIDAISGGRLVVGVGVGWLREEFQALGADFESRGCVLDEWLEIARQCWTGSAGPYQGRFYRLPTAIHCKPIPVRQPPILIGGMSKAAYRRAASGADGWVAQFSLTTVDPDGIASAISEIRAAAQERGRPAADLERLRIVTRVSGTGPGFARLTAMLGEIAAAGASEIVVDVDWSDPEGAARTCETLRSAVA